LAIAEGRAKVNTSEFWTVTATRLITDEAAGANLRPALAELLQLLDFLLNRDALKTLDFMLPKKGAAENTAARLVMDYLGLVEEHGVEGEEGSQRTLANDLLFESSSLMCVVTNPFDPQDRDDHAKILAGIKQFSGTLCGEEAVAIVDVVAELLMGKTVTKQTAAKMVKILSNSQNGNKPLIKGADKDKAQAFVLGVFALCEDNADIMEFRHCALTLGNFDKKVVDIIRNFAQGTHKEAQSKDAAENKVGDGYLAKVFAMFDSDKSGKIDFNEFNEMLRYLNINISQEKAIQIFTMCDSDGSKELSYDEFEKGFLQLAKEVAITCLKSMGLSDVQIYGTVGSGLVILLGMFVFIFLGMAAFTENSTFGSMVNSGFALGAGGAQAASDESTVDPDDPKIMDYLQEKVMEALEELNPQ